MLSVQQPSLEEIYGSGPDFSKYIEGGQRSEMARQNHAQNLAEAQAQAYREQQLHPLAVQEKQQLIRQRQLGNTLAEAEQPFALKKIQYGAEEADYKAQQQFGQALEQWGSIAEANGGQIPLQLQQRMPPELAQLFAQPNGWQQAKQAGSAMREASMKWLQQQSKQGSAEDIAAQKAAMDKYKADLRAKAAEDANATRLAVQRQMAAGKGEAAVKTLDQAYVTYLNKASTSTDPEERAFYTQLAQEVVAQKNEYIDRQARAKLTGTIDAAAVASMPTVKAPPPRTVAPPTKGGAVYKKDDKGRIVLD